MLIPTMKLKNGEIAVTVAVKENLWRRVRSASVLAQIPVREIVDKALSDLMVSWDVPPAKSTTKP